MCVHSVLSLPIAPPTPIIFSLPFPVKSSIHPLSLTLGGRPSTLFTLALQATGNHYLGRCWALTRALHTLTQPSFCLTATERTPTRLTCTCSPCTLPCLMPCQCHTPPSPVNLQHPSTYRHLYLPFGKWSPSFFACRSRSRRIRSCFSLQRHDI